MKSLLNVALTLSLIANAVLGVLFYRVLRMSRGMPLPRKKPDFSFLERELSAVLKEPEFSEIVELHQFETKEWICAAVLVHRVEDIRPHWEKINHLVKRVSVTCKVPGRIAGWYSDPNDPRKEIGTIVQFGYSQEVGYRQPNEFYVE